MTYQHHWGERKIYGEDACWDCGVRRAGHTDPCDVPPEMSESRLTLRCYPQYVRAYHSGKTVLGFLVGQTVKRNAGKLDEEFVRRCLVALLKDMKAT